MGILYSTNGKIWMDSSLVTKGPFQRRGRPTLQTGIHVKSVSTSKERAANEWLGSAERVTHGHVGP